LPGSLPAGIAYFLQPFHGLTAAGKDFRQDQRQGPRFILRSKKKAKLRFEFT